MKKIIELTDEAIARLMTGKCVEGSLRMNERTGKVTFRAYQRQSHKRKQDRIVRQLEHGWLKESARRIKFFNSVKKDLGSRLVDVTIHRELKTAMSALVFEKEILNKI